MDVEGGGGEGGREEWGGINEYWVHKATNAIIRNIWPSGGHE